jgi:hypothetical protein
MTDKILRAPCHPVRTRGDGFNLDDLLAVAGREATRPTPGPTVADYVAVVAESYQPRSRRTYSSYWRLTVELLGDVALDRVTVDDILGVADEAVRRAMNRRVGGDGRASRETCVAANRAVSSGPTGRD